MRSEHLLDPDVQTVAEDRDERSGVGFHVEDREARQARFVEGSDVALVVAGDDDPDVVGQLHVAHPAQGHQGQRSGGHVGGCAVDLVEEEQRALTRVGLGVVDAFLDDLVRVEDLLVTLRTVILGVRHQAGTGQVGLVGELVAGEHEGLGVHGVGQVLHEGALADAGLAHEGGGGSNLESLAGEIGQGVVESHDGSSLSGSDGGRRRRERTGVGGGAALQHTATRSRSARSSFAIADRS